MVWFQFSAAQSPEHVDALMKRLRALEHTVPGILRLEAGANFTDRSRGFTHGLVVTLESKGALDAYQIHPEHVAVAKDLRAACEGIVALDFEH